jgi:hypothetical protein
MSNDGSFVLGHRLHAPRRLWPAPFDAVLELDRAPVSDAGQRVQGPDRAAEHVGSDRDALRGRQDLQVDSRPGPERARPLNERATRADIHQRDGAPRAERRTGLGARRQLESRVNTTVH